MSARVSVRLGPMWARPLNALSFPLSVCVCARLQLTIYRPCTYVRMPYRPPHGNVFQQHQPAFTSVDCFVLLSFGGGGGGGLFFLL
ncbi:hypothetical protein F4802DRAFT_544395, partial [Xylaria palmicola]